MSSSKVRKLQKSVEAIQTEKLQLMKNMEGSNEGDELESIYEKLSKALHSLHKENYEREIEHLTSARGE